MEDGQLCRRVERGAARLVNQNLVLGNRSDVVRVDEVVDQALGRRVVDVRRVDADGVAVLGELFLLEPFVVGTRVVVRIGTCLNGSRSARCCALHVSRRRQTVRADSISPVGGRNSR